LFCALFTIRESTVLAALRLKTGRRIRTTPASVADFLKRFLQLARFSSPQRFCAFLSFAWAMLALGCNSATTPAPKNVSTHPDRPAWFVETAESWGVRHTYRNGQEAGYASILESLGGGVGALDYDLDGRIDLCFTGGGNLTDQKQIVGLPSALFRNLGKGHFDTVTSQAGWLLAQANLSNPQPNPAPTPATDRSYYSHGLACGDYDNDGFVDVVVTGYGGLVFWKNQGDGTFMESAAESGLLDTQWSSSAGWADLNADGMLDLFVVHYVDWSFANDPYCGGPRSELREICPPASFHGLSDSLYINQGDGTFLEQGRERGLSEEGKGLGVVLGDVDLDGDVDVYVANDNTPNFLYQNDGMGRFEEVGLISGVSLGDNGSPDGSMGVDLGDFDEDGWPDIWVANFERESFALYRNLGSANFYHASQSLGITALGSLYVGWGTMFADFDLDRDPDLFVANGHVVLYPENAPLMQRPLLLENEGGKRIRNRSDEAGLYFQQAHMGRGAVATDLDQDGRLDLVVSHTNQPVAVLHNVYSTQHGWLAVRLVGRASSRDAVGARITVRWPGQQLTRQVLGGGSYASSRDPWVHFGLGSAELIEELIVDWPTGRQTVLRQVGRNQRLTLHEPVEP